MKNIEIKETTILGSKNYHLIINGEKLFTFPKKEMVDSYVQMIECLIDSNAVLWDCYRSTDGELQDWIDSVAEMNCKALKSANILGEHYQPIKNKKTKGYDSLTSVQKAFYDGYEKGYNATKE